MPLVEAMYFDVPIVAYESTAIPSTLGGSGVLLKEKDPVLTGETMRRVLTDEALRQKILQGQRARLKDFSYESVKTLFERQLSAFLKETAK